MSPYFEDITPTAQEKNSDVPPTLPPPEAHELLPKDFQPSIPAPFPAPPAEPAAKIAIKTMPEAVRSQKSSVGPVVGIVIIVLLLAVGALYFWGAHLNARANRYNNLPFIPGNSTTTVE